MENNELNNAAEIATTETPVKMGGRFKTFVNNHPVAGTMALTAGMTAVSMLTMAVIDFGVAAAKNTVKTIKEKRAAKKAAKAKVVEAVVVPINQNPEQKN